MNERGSTLVMALVMLVLLGVMAFSLVFLTSGEVAMSRSDVRSKSAFFLAESGMELGRVALTVADVDEDFDNDLLAASVDSSIDFDPDKLVPQFGSDGRLTGLTGFGNDLPLVAVVTGDGGWYAAFLSNDPLDGRTSLTDSNGRVTITGFGAVAGGSVEVVEAIVQRGDVSPIPPPAAITLIGENPNFDGGNSNAKKYKGDDCDGAGVPGLNVPVIGTTSAAAVTDAQSGIFKPNTYTSDSYVGDPTTEDITDPSSTILSASGMPTLDPAWQSCADLQALLAELEWQADTSCPGPCSSIPLGPPGQLVYVDGDLTLGPVSGAGMLVVTGTFVMHGQADWRGMIYVVGEGIFDRTGGGNGLISGATLVADIAGPDNVYGTADDCTGPDNGFDAVTYDQSGGGTGDTVFCTNDINASTPVRPYRIVDFRQR